MTDPDRKKMQDMLDAMAGNVENIFMLDLHTASPMLIANLILVLRHDEDITGKSHWPRIRQLREYAATLCDDVQSYTTVTRKRS